MSTWLRPWLFIPAAVAALAGCLIWLSHMRYELSLESQRMATEKKAIEQESSGFRLEIASLTRPERLRQYARDTLSMAPPKPMQVIRP